MFSKTQLSNSVKILENEQNPPLLAGLSILVGRAHRGLRCPTSVLGNYFQKCLFANAYPEPVLRYCSNSNAASLELNAK